MIGVQHFSVDCIANDITKNSAFIFSCVLEESFQDSKENIILHEIITEEFITSKMLSIPSLLTLLHAIYFLNYEKSNFNINLLSILLYGTQTWSNKFFIQKATNELHEYVSRVLVYIFQLFYKQTDLLRNSDEFMEISKFILSGVQNHLGAPRESFRKWGMVIYIYFLLLCKINNNLF